MSAPLDYLSESDFVATTTTVAAKCTLSVSPVPSTTMSACLNESPAVCRRTVQGGTVVFTNLHALRLLAIHNMFSVSHITIAAGSEIMYESDVTNQVMNMSSIFPEPIFATVSVDFTCLNTESSPIIEYIPYSFKRDARWACGVPTYSRVISSQCKYVIALPACDLQFTRDARISWDLTETYELTPQPQVGTLVKDSNIYTVDVFTGLYSKLIGYDFGPQVTVIGGGVMIMTSPPCLEYLVEKDHIESFAVQVHELCPDVSVIYTPKFYAPPELIAELERKSLQDVEALYQRIVGLHNTSH